MEIMVKGTVKQTVTIVADPTPYLRLLGNQHVTNAIIGQLVEFKIEYPVGTVKADQIVAAFQNERGDVTEPTTVVALGEGKFAVRFTPKRPGKYTTKVSVKGAGTMDGELVVDAIPAPGIQLIEGASGLATVGKQFIFKLSAPDTRAHQLEVSVKSPGGHTDRARVVDLSDGIFDIIYTPTAIGKYTAEIKLNGGLISKPLVIDARSDVKWLSHVPVAKGEMLVGKEFEFKIEVHEVNVDNLSVIVEDADHHQVHQSNLYHTGGNQYALKWKPPTGGYYGCQIFLDGKPIGDSIQVYATEPKAETGGKNSSRGKVGNIFNVTVTLEDMEHKKVEAHVKDQYGQHGGHVHVEPAGGNKFKLSYKPEKVGVYTCTLVIDGVPIAGSDLFFDAHA